MKTLYRDPELKQRRRRRQRERQKSNWFRLAKQQLCTCITLFCTFLCRHCTTTTWNVLIPPFLENVNTRPRLSFSFPELRYSLLEFNSRKKLCQHLTNWTRRNKRYLVWSSLNSPFKWRFHRHRRLCCLSSLLISWTPPLKNKHLAAPNARIFQLFVLGCLPFVKTDRSDKFNRKGNSTITLSIRAVKPVNF